MTDENRRHNIGLEVAEAEDRLAAATAVLHHSFKSTATLAYYGAFHYARALLLAEGLQAKTHKGVVQLVNMHFVQQGRLSPELSRVLSVLQAERERAEYDVAAVLTQEMATAALADARRFAEAATLILTEAGFL